MADILRRSDLPPPAASHHTKAQLQESKGPSLFFHSVLGYGFDPASTDMTFCSIDPE